MIERHIAQQALHLHRSRSGMGMSIFFVLLAAVIVPTSILLSHNWPKSLAFGGGVPLSFLALLWWVNLVGACHAQMQSPSTFLVPDLERRVRRTLLLFWAVASILLGMVWGPGTGGIVQATAWSALALINLVYFYDKLGWSVVLGILLINTGIAEPIKALLVGPLGGPTVLAVALLQAWWLLMRAPSRRFGMLDLRDQPVESPLTGLSFAAICAALKLDAHQRKPDQRTQWRLDLDPAALLLKVLGDRGRPFDTRAWLRSFSLLLAMAAIARGAAYVFAGGVLPKEVGVVALLFFVTPVLFEGFIFYNAVYAGSGEQGVLRLAVRTPAPQQVNAILARAWLQKFWRTWLSCLVSGTVLLLVLGADFHFLRSFCAAMLCAIGLAEMGLWNYAGPRRRNWSSAALLAAWMGVVLIQGMLLKVSDNTLAATALLGAFVGVLSIWQRRSAMLGAASAFPAGRMA